MTSSYCSQVYGLIVNINTEVDRKTKWQIKKKSMAKRESREKQYDVDKWANTAVQLQHGPFKLKDALAKIFALNHTCNLAVTQLLQHDTAYSQMIVNGHFTSTTPARFNSTVELRRRRRCEVATKSCCWFYFYRCCCCYVQTLLIQSTNTRKVLLTQREMRNSGAPSYASDS